MNIGLDKLRRRRETKVFYTDAFDMDWEDVDDDVANAAETELAAEVPVELQCADDLMKLVPELAKGRAEVAIRQELESAEGDEGTGDEDSESSVSDRDDSDIREDSEDGEDGANGEDNADGEDGEMDAQDDFAVEGYAPL